MALGPCKHPPLPNKPGSNWVEKTGGLPKFIDCVARAIYHSGRSQGDVSKAISIAVGRVEDWAAGKGGVKPDTRAQAVAAVAEWNAKRAAAKAQTKNLSDHAREVIDLAFDEAKHPRIKSGHGGGEFTKLVGRVEKLKVASGSVKVPIDGKRFKRIERVATSGDRQFRVNHAAHATHHATAYEAVAKALAKPQSSSLPKRINSRAMVLSDDLRERVTDLTERLGA